MYCRSEGLHLYTGVYDVRAYPFSILADRMGNQVTKMYDVRVLARQYQEILVN